MKAKYLKINISYLYYLIIYNIYDIYAHTRIRA